MSNLIATPLYQLVIAYNNLLDQYSQAESDEDLMKLEADLTAVQDSIYAKSTQIAFAVRNTEAYEEAIDSEIERLRDRQKKFQKFIEWAKNYISNMLKAANIEKVETELITISFRKSKRVEILNEAEIPEQYIRKRITIEPNKIAIKAAWEAGLGVTGTEVVEDKHIQIK